MVTRGSDVAIASLAGGVIVLPVEFLGGLVVLDDVLDDHGGHVSG